MKRASSVTALLVLTSSLAAQTRISTVPQEVHAMEGHGFGSLPFQHSNMRMQIYYGARHVGLKNPGVLTHVGIRAEGGFSFQNQGKTLNWTVAMGETKTAFSAVSKTFDNNASAPLTTVFQGKILLPTTKTGTPPKIGGAVAMLKMSKPYVYLGGNLLIEILAQDASGKNQSSSYYSDLVRSFGAGNTLFDFLGRGCPAGSNQLSVTINNVRPGGQLRSILRYASITTGNAFLAFGSNARQWGPLTLPLDLGPAGAPGCYLWTDIAFVLPKAVTARTADLSVPIPNDSRLIGALINDQWLVLDSTRNALGITTAPLVQRVISSTGTYEIDTAYLYWAGTGKPATQTTASSLFTRQSPVLLLGHP